MWRCNRNSYGVTHHVPPLPVLYCRPGSIRRRNITTVRHQVTNSKHPAVLNFPAQAGRISALMRNNEDFAGICQDYVEVVGEIARSEQSPDHRSAALAELLRLRSDIERDIVDCLSKAEVESHDEP